MSARSNLLPRVALVAGSLALLSACAKAPPEKAEPIRPVHTVVAEPGREGTPIVLPGEVRPRVETRYGFRIGGKLSERRVSVGDRVADGTVLARLDPQDVMPAVDAQQAQLEAVRTELKLAQIELGRLRELRDRNYVSQAQVDRQQAAADAARARLEAAQAQLTQARNAAEFQVLKADVAGVVTAVDAEAGQVLAAGQAVVRVAATAEKEVLVNVPERDLARVRGIRSWQVVLPGREAQPLAARVREVSPLADPASRTYAMRATLQGDTAGVELGMSATLRPVSADDRGDGKGDSRGSDSPVFVLPLSALYAKDRQPHVWVVDPAASTVRAVPVRTAGFMDESVRVVEGVKRGDRIVTAGANLLTPGQKVRLTEAAR